MDELLRVGIEYPFITLLFVLVYLVIGVGTAYTIKTQGYRVWVRVVGLFLWPMLFAYEGLEIVVLSVIHNFKYVINIFRD